MAGGATFEGIEEAVTISLAHTQEARYINASSQTNITVHGFWTDGTPLNPSSSTTTSMSLGLLGDSFPLHQPMRSLEIIGDSITAGEMLSLRLSCLLSCLIITLHFFCIPLGFGAAGTKPCNQSIFTNDHSLTYSHLLCRGFQAQVQIAAFPVVISRWPTE